MLTDFINNISETCTILYINIQLLEYTLNKLKDKFILKHKVPIYQYNIVYKRTIGSLLPLVVILFMEKQKGYYHILLLIRLLGSLLPIGVIPHRGITHCYRLVGLSGYLNYCKLRFNYEN